MKKYIVIALSLAVALFATSCIKETYPTSQATKEQIGQSASALEATVRGIPSQLVQGYLIYGYQQYEYDMGYPGIMIMLDSACGELTPVGNTGYDWYWYWGADIRLGETSGPTYVPFRAFYMFVKSANDVIGAVSDPETASATQLKFLGEAYAYRAHAYLDMARIYECKKPTDPNVKNYAPEDAILGLTVPIVTEKTTLEEAKANPRASVDDVYELIFSDLDNAEKYLEGTDKPSLVYPSLAVVYGLQARAYLERGSAKNDKALFAKAAEYAKKARAEFGGSPLTQAQWEDPTNGFNSSSANSNSWMWCLSYSAETMGNLCNFVAHMSSEEIWTAYGWAVQRGVNRNLYDTIADTDFRKHSWLDPDGKAYYDYKLNRDIFDEENKPLYPYAGLKFRPASGDYATYKVGGASQVPLMRIEEMYLIQAEAEAMSGDLEAGKATLAELVITRDPAYDCSAYKNAEAFQKEVYRQKRIELWGEGLVFFDAKRLGAGVNRGYTGTNAQDDYCLNCEGVAPWWNWVIPQTEISSNPAIDGFNNPDPSSTVDPWTE